MYTSAETSMTVIKNQKVEFKLNGLLDCEILLTEK